MSITIDISAKTEEKIRRRAKQLGQKPEKVVSRFVEETWAEHFQELEKTGNESKEEEEFENPLTPFIGMFSSGKTDTSTRAKEILREGIKMPGGWGGGE